MGRVGRKPYHKVRNSLGQGWMLRSSQSSGKGELIQTLHSSNLTVPNRTKGPLLSAPSNSAACPGSKPEDQKVGTGSLPTSTEYVTIQVPGFLLGIILGPHFFSSYNTHRLGGLRRWSSALQCSKPCLHVLGGRDGTLGFIS